jgi:hypothetical protein
MQDAESKLIFIDSEGKVRSLRGLVAFEDGWVVVTRSDGTMRVPTHRVLQIEQWTGSGGART